MQFRKKERYVSPRFIFKFKPIYLIITIIGFIIYSFISLHLKNKKVILLKNLEKKLVGIYKNEIDGNLIDCSEEILKLDSMNYKTRMIRAEIFVRNQEYSKSFKELEYIFFTEPKDYYPYYLKGLSLINTDSGLGCNDITRAINMKGSLISARDLPLDYIDSNRLLDIDYRELLKLRLLNCGKEYPTYIRLDSALLNME